MKRKTDWIDHCHGGECSVSGDSPKGSPECALAGEGLANTLMRGQAQNADTGCEPSQHFNHNIVKGVVD